MDGAPGRVFVACFSSNVHRIQQVVDAGAGLRPAAGAARARRWRRTSGSAWSSATSPSRPGPAGVARGGARPAAAARRCVARHRHPGRAAQRAGPRLARGEHPDLPVAPRRPGAPLLPPHPRQRGGHRPHRGRPVRAAAPRCSGRTSGRSTPPATPRRRSSGGSCALGRPEHFLPIHGELPPPGPPRRRTPRPRGSPPTGATCSSTARCWSSPTPGCRALAGPAPLRARPPGPRRRLRRDRAAGRGTRSARCSPRPGIVLVVLVVDRGHAGAGAAPGGPGTGRGGARGAGGGGGRRGAAGARGGPAARRSGTRRRWSGGAALGGAALVPARPPGGARRCRWWCWRSETRRDAPGGDGDAELRRGERPRHDGGRERLPPGEEGDRAALRLQGDLHRPRARQQDGSILLKANSDGRVDAAYTVLMEKFAKRGVPLEGLDPQTIEPAAGGHVKRLVKLTAGPEAGGREEDRGAA